MLHLENEALMHGQRLREDANRARLVAEAQGPRPSLFSLLAGPLFHRRPKAVQPPVPSMQPQRVVARMEKRDAW
jgi:hypothetical protein